MPGETKRPMVPERVVLRWKPLSTDRRTARLSAEPDVREPAFCDRLRQHAAPSDRCYVGVPDPSPVGTTVMPQEFAEHESVGMSCRVCELRRALMFQFSSLNQDGCGQSSL